MKKVISFVIMLVILLTTIPSLSMATSAQNITIEYDSEIFNYIPSDSVYVNGNEYKKYVVIENYQELTHPDVVYVDSNNTLVTDPQLLGKLVYTSIIKSRIAVGTDTYNVLKEIEKISPALDIIEDLGNDLIEKTLSSAISCNFKGIISAAEGNLIDYAKEYADFINSSAIEGTLYLSYLINLNSLTTACIENSEKLEKFNDTIGKQIDQNGLSYEDAKQYETIIRDCIGVLKATEEYTVYLAQCVSGNGVNNSVDAWGILGNMTVDFAGEAFGQGIACAFTEDIAELIGFCSGFDDLFKTTYDSLAIDDKIQYYYAEYQIIDSDAPYYIDINDVIENVSILTKEDISDSSAFENDYVNTGDYNEDIIGVAYTQNGYRELDPVTGEPVFYTPDDIESGVDKPFYSKYGDYFGHPNGQWCAYFVMWCAAEADIPKTVLPQARKYGNCGTFVQWFKDNGKWRNSDYTPVPGDIIFFYDEENPNAASHVGIVESVNSDGSIETIEGNTLNWNYYQVCHKTRSSNILGYGVLSDDTDGSVNGFIVEGGKTVGKAYMLPDKNSETVWYVDTDDRCILLCYDSDTDFYLLMYPFLNTGKYVTAYVPGDIVSRYMEPYVPIPDASDFYNINKQIYLDEKTTVYHNPSTTALMNGSKDVSVRAEWDVDTQVTVLFEYNNYYFVITETQSGFVPKEKIDINSTYAPEVPEIPDVPDTPETPDDPEPPTPPAEETYLLGDVNMDGTVDKADGTLILEYCAEICLLSDEQLALADANSDGLVNVADAGFIFTTLTNTEG